MDGREGHINFSTTFWNWDGSGRFFPFFFSSTFFLFHHHILRHFFAFVGGLFLSAPSSSPLCALQSWPLIDPITIIWRFSGVHKSAFLFAGEEILQESLSPFAVHISLKKNVIVVCVFPEGGDTFFPSAIPSGYTMFFWVHLNAGFHQNNYLFICFFDERES